MSETAEILLSRIDARLAEMGKSRYWLSMEASDGKTHQIVTDIERKGTIPREPRLVRIAEVLGVTTDWLMGRSLTPDHIKSEVEVADNLVTVSRRDHDLFHDGIPIVGTGDCADLQVCDESGNMVSIERSSFDADYHVRMITRPPALRGARDIYAIYFHGESMLPRFEPGEVGIVDPQRPARPGDYVLVQLNSGDTDEVVSVLVKRLVRQTAKDLVLEQFNPALTFTVPKTRVARVHRILQQTDLLFG